MLALALAGCGGGTRDAATPHVPKKTATPTAAADCLNSVLFFVEAGKTTVRGAAPDGVNFIARFYPSQAEASAAMAAHNPKYAVKMGATVIDFSGNPPAHKGGPPRILIKNDFRALRYCIVPL